MAVRYVPSKSFGRDMANDAAWRDGSLEVAQAIADDAKASAPRGFMGTRQTYGANSTSGVAQVVASRGWHLIEFGTLRTSPRAVVRKAVQRLGLRLEAS